MRPGSHLKYLVLCPSLWHQLEVYLFLWQGWPAFLAVYSFLHKHDDVQMRDPQILTSTAVIITKKLRLAKLTWASNDISKALTSAHSSFSTNNWLSSFFNFTISEVNNALSNTTKSRRLTSKKTMQAPENRKKNNKEVPKPYDTLFFMRQLYRIIVVAFAKEGERIKLTCSLSQVPYFPQIRSTFLSGWCIVPYKTPVGISPGTCHCEKKFHWCNKCKKKF